MIFTPAYAQAAAETSGGGLFAQLLPLFLIVIIFYFLLIRPQQKRTREHREMLTALAVSDEVVTSSGIMGRVLDIHDNSVTLDLGDSKVRFQKNSVQMILPKGTL